MTSLVHARPRLMVAARVESLLPLAVGNDRRRAVAVLKLRLPIVFRSVGKPRWLLVIVILRVPLETLR